MNTVFLIGNGFDLNLELATRYSDFYKYYVKCPPAYIGDSVVKFKNEIDSYLTKQTSKTRYDIDWSDLEAGLGAYTERLGIEDYENIHLDVILRLKEYLQMIDEGFHPEKILMEKVAKDFCQPEQSGSFNPAETSQLSNFKNSAELLRIINFNYTYTVEKLLENPKTPQKIGVNAIGHEVILQELVHIHHSLNDDHVLVGVNDNSQIANKEFRSNEDICDLLVKAQTNDMMGLNINNRCSYIIDGAHLIVLFGLSLGSTDKRWWKLIGRRLANSDCRIIYFVHAEGLDPDYEIHQGKIKRKCKKNLFKLMDIENEYNKYESRVYVGYGANLFKC